jgi:lauroyl/myristoyl acyltransferase
VTSLKQWIAYLALRLGLAVLGILPEPVVRWLGRMGGRVWYALDGRRRRMALRHMRRLGQPPSRALEVFESYGRYWAESLWVRPRRLSAMWKRMSVDGMENLHLALQGGRGAVVVLPHVGNWEAAALIAAHEAIPLVAVAERLANRRITEWFTRQRNMFGIEIVLTGQRLTPVLLQALEEGKLVCLLSDRDLSGRGLEVQFFGETTTLPAGPVVLSRKAGVPILPAAVFFNRGPGHHAIIRRPLPPPEDTAEGIRAVARELEELVRHDPAQWHLVQPNWPSDRTGG